MADTTVTNWFGDLVLHPRVVAEATSAEDIAAILKNSTQYSSPVRAIGSNHSTERCGVADGGTVIKMSGMNKILDISNNTVTVQTGAVSTANPGWADFLGAYNQFCSDQGGVPLMNQTFGLTPAMVQRALGDRLRTFAQARQTLLASADSAAAQ